jgi:hypothetical protein
MRSLTQSSTATSDPPFIDSSGRAAEAVAAELAAVMSGRNDVPASRARTSGRREARYRRGSRNRLRGGDQERNTAPYLPLGACGVLWWAAGRRRLPAAGNPRSFVVRQPSAAGAFCGTRGYGVTLRPRCSIVPGCGSCSTTLPSPPQGVGFGPAWSPRCPHDALQDRLADNGPLTLPTGVELRRVGAQHAVGPVPIAGVIRPVTPPRPADPLRRARRPTHG